MRRATTVLGLALALLSAASSPAAAQSRAESRDVQVEALRSLRSTISARGPEIALFVSDSPADSAELSRLSQAAGNAKTAISRELRCVAADQCSDMPANVTLVTVSAARVDGNKAEVIVRVLRRGRRASGTAMVGGTIYTVSLTKVTGVWKAVGAKVSTS